MTKNILIYEKYHELFRSISSVFYLVWNLKTIGIIIIRTSHLAGQALMPCSCCNVVFVFCHSPYRTCPPRSWSDLTTRSMISVTISVPQVVCMLITRGYLANTTHGADVGLMANVADGGLTLSRHRIHAWCFWVDCRPIRFMIQGKVLYVYCHGNIYSLIYLIVFWIFSFCNILVTNKIK